MSAIQVAVLTVSDTASVDPSADRSGPTIRQILSQNGHECKHLAIVPDDEASIREMVKSWCNASEVDLVLTTGGTGFGVHDRTPEAIAPLIERQAPGLVHLLLSSSLRHTPFAALSRPLAGTIRNTLVVTLPGSVKAVKENLEALLSGGVLDHAVDLIRGGTGKQVHQALSQTPYEKNPAGSQEKDIHSHGHRHHHPHGSHSHTVPKARTANALSHDPSGPVSARHRISPYPLVSVNDAFNQIAREIQPLSPREEPVTPQLRGHVLAENIYAPRDVPNTLTTNVDGYAVRSTDPPGIYKVLTSRTHNLSDPLPAGTIFRVNTGGPLPAGTDAVIMVEDTRLKSTIPDASGTLEENDVETLAAMLPGENVRQPGSDVKIGDLVLEKGQIVTSAGGEVGSLVFVGRNKVKVYPKLVVAILSTGNELLDLQSPQKLDEEGWGGIWDTNRPSLQAALEGMGYRVVDLGIVPDNLDAHVAVLKKGLACADLLLTTGGTSMGASDLLKPVIEHHLNGTIHFGRVKVKPGKPTTFATLPTPDSGNQQTPMFALPGNPASALVTFHIFVVPALRRLGGVPDARCHLPRVHVKLQEAMRLDARPEFHRVTLQWESDGLKAYSTGGQRSSRVASLAGANGLVALPPREEGGPERLQAGDLVEAVVIGELQTRL